jgi:hypothetical protein
MAEGTLPKISVIIPVFNGTNYLREAIDSVLSQTYKNYEIVVVDDGSTDETWAVIQSYGSSLRSIRKENGGVASALNCGIQQAKGDYIAWLSHDDLFLPNKLERQVDFLKQFAQFKACYTDYYTIDENGKILEEIETPWYPRQEAIRILFGRVYINGSTMLIERRCFDKVGLFSERLRYTQDTEMWLRFSRYFEIGRVPEKLGKWRLHSSQGSQSIQIHRVEAQAMYQRIFEEFGIEGLFPEWKESANNPKTIARAYVWLGDTMSYDRGWHMFADEQYIYAIEVYPSLRNVARVKRIINRALSIVRPAYHRVRWLGQIGLRIVEQGIRK